MITLNEYLNRPIITQELVDIFEEFINSTYNENVLCENLISEAEKGSKNDSEEDNIIYIGIEIINCQTQYNIINDSKSDENKDDIDTFLSNLEKEYNKILSKVTFKDKKIPDEFKITNNIDNDKNALDKIENNPKMGEIIADFRSLSDKIKNTIKNLKEKSSDDNNEELKDGVKTNDNTKEIADKVKKLQKSFNDKLKEVNNFINKLKDKEIKKSFLSTPDSIKTTYEYYNNIQVNTVKRYINDKQYDKANEYVKDSLEPYTSKRIKQLDDLITTIKTELEFANNNKSDNENETSEDAKVTPEVKQTAETETNIIKNALVKKVASEVNIDIVSLGKLYVQITKQLSKSNKLTKEMVDTIANTNDDDAIIGLNLMLLGAVTTKNLPNRAKIISEYCSIIQQSIKKKNYDKIFNKQSKKESN